jgi:hypothetical protein
VTLLNRVEYADQLRHLGGPHTESFVGTEMDDPRVELIWLVHPVDPLLVQHGKLLQTLR